MENNLFYANNLHKDNRNFFYHEYLFFIKEYGSSISISCRAPCVATLRIFYKKELMFISRMSVCNYR